MCLSFVIWAYVGKFHVLRSIPACRFYSVVRRMSGEGERGGGVVVFLCSSICVYRQSPSTYATKGR